MFWNAVNQRSIRLNSNRSLLILTKGFLHLYTNPTARRNWCEKNNEQFVLPQAPQGVTHPPPPPYNYDMGESAWQAPSPPPYNNIHGQVNHAYNNHNNF